ncbi:MAG: oligosaccharide flippase family protein [Clostridia bacterium]|nr:oligosaccharide flippase family protein [Clostridia bacterium]
MASLKKQALTLTLANAYTRALGFVLRLLSARLMGAEAMGVMELSSSAIMLAITPVTAGIPTAISRLTALPGADEKAVLRSGLSLVKRLSLALIPALLLLSPGMAWLLGDWRTLPSILTSAPAILLLGLCAVYSGWFCGRADMRTPAFNECAEQTVRCCLSVALLLWLSGRSAALTAALPGIAEIAAGIAVWVLFRRSAPQHSGMKADPLLTRQVLHLAAPTTAARLCQTALRALNAVLLPVCLRRSGLTQAAATAQFGLLNGMAMPLLMLPGIVTGAICTVAAPAVSRQEKQPLRLRRIMRQLLLSGAGVGLAASALLFLGAEFISTRLYTEPALAPLLRLMAPAALLTSLQQVQFGLITGLGLQKKALAPTITCALITLAFTAALCPLPQIRLYGAAVASLASALVRTVWNQALLHRAVAGLSQACSSGVFRQHQPCGIQSNMVE